LTSTTVNLNQAGTGGGIYMNGDGGAANLYLNAYSEIIFNTVTGSGGGIFLEGQARLFALYSHTLIGFNHAPQGYGGGIGVIGPARVDIGSTGFNGLPVVYNNSALYGGGISATADSDQDTVIRLFTNDAQAPVQISDNIASATGGAIYLKSFFGFDSSPATSILCAFSFRMEDNIAQEGTAIYADSDFFLGSGVGSYVALNEDTSAKQYCSSPEPLASFGAVSCETGVPCNRISGNVAEDSDGVATLGSTILVQSGGQLAADRIEARANAGAHFLRQVSDDGQSLGDVRLTDCLLAGNALTQELVAKTDGDNDLLLIDSCTFAANQIGAPYAFVGRGTFYLVNSIIDQPGRATIDVPGATVANILSNDVTTLPTTPDIVLGEPTFIDATHGDFHLRPGSLGIDFAPGETLDRKHLLDLDGKTRVVDLPYTPNYIGAMDLGAYEIQLDAIFPCARDDTIFCTGFELTN
jgi:hypothetical protein